MQTFLKAILLLLAVASMNVMAAQKSTHSVQDFFSHAKFETIVISPDGKHFAVTYRDETEVKMAVINRKTNKVVSGFDYGEYRQIGRPVWVSNERIIFSVRKFVGLWDTKGGPASIMAVNIDGKRRVNLTKEAGYFSIVSYLKGNEREVLIQKTRYEGGELKAKLHRLDVYKGKTRYVPDTPEKSVMAYIADAEGVPRVSVRYEIEDGEIEPSLELFYKDLGGQWRSLKVDSELEKPRFDFIGISEDQTEIFFSSDYDDKENQILGIHKINLASGKVSLVKRHDYVDLGLFVDTAPDGSIISYGYDDGYMAKDYLNTNHWYAQLARSLDASFPDSIVRITSVTADNNEAVIQVFSDKNPGEFFIFNRKQGKLKFYGAAKREINPKQMADMKPFNFKARDGVELHGYLTTPKGVKAKDLPTIVMIHGGPHGPRDNWGWNPEAQFLAANGYAVVQVNFRGSGGYGKTFERSGYLKWGREMQDDVTDATLWAVEKGIADKDRLCVYGGSYGGYATAMAVVREPDLYKCALPYVGVYSLQEMKVSGDIPTSKGGRTFLDTVLGMDEADMSARSPADNVDKIKANLFIAHGEADERCPMEQYEVLTEALDKAGKEYKYMLRDEGHGYQIEKNRFDFYSAMLEFFDENLM